jgi:predicted ribosomally synthesized peptide with SipW-like signal peptide
MGMSKKRTKQYLLLLMVIGLVSIAAGGSGTFASFSAETTNAGNYFATGSLFLHNTHGATTCTSESASGNLNNGLNGDTCSTLFNVNINDGNPTFASLTLKNAGTVNASGIKFKLAQACASAIAYQTNTTLGANFGTSDTSLTVAPTTVYIRTGKHIDVTDGTNSDELVVSGNVPVGATSISVTSSPTHNYVTGNNVMSSAEFGTPDLCGALKFTVDETNASFQHAAGQNATCAYPAAADAGDGSGCDFTNGAVGFLSAAPTSLTPLSLASAGGTGNTLTQLSANGTRYFVIGIQPNAAVLDNTYQLRKASFDLVWHIDQA